MKNNGMVVIDANRDTGIALNTLARHQMIVKLMRDIRVDIAVCQIEGVDYKDYLLELKSIIDGFLKER